MTSTTCPSCAAPASGRFCAECGATLGTATCAACDATLSAGAKFCHRCGTPAGAAPATRPTAASRASLLPWGIVAVALVALVALVAGQRFSATSASSGDAPAATAAAETGPAVVRGPDISQMTPQQRAARLYDRAMSARDAGKLDSAAFFATMATMAYQQLPSLDADARFDMGRVAILAGALPLAKAQSDSILAAEPAHLLGLLLAEELAKASGDAPGASAAHAKLLAAAPAELKKNRPEYQLHQSDITAATSARATP